MKELKEYRGVRVLVTGASGFIGRWVAKLLSEEGAYLWIVGRDRSRLNSVSEVYSITGTKVILDLAEENRFEKLFEEIRPDVTFNVIGYGISQQERDEKTAWRINADLVGEMALTIARGNESKWKGMKLVHIGSGFEYGSVPEVITEKTKPEARTIYGRSKLAGTERLQEISESTGLAAVTARVFMVYGPGENPQRLLPSLIRTAISGEILRLTKGEQKRDFTYVRDVALGLLRLGLALNVPGRTVNLASGNLTSIKDFVRCAQGLLNMSSDQIYFGAIPYREDEVWQGNVDVAFLRKCIGWVPSYSLLEGIRETIDFEKSRESLFGTN